jgi:hypothetical protein
MFERTIECFRAVRLIGLIALLMAPTCSVAAEETDKPTDKQTALPDVRTHGNTQRAGLLKNGTLWLNPRA